MGVVCICCNTNSSFFPCKNSVVVISVRDGVCVEPPTCVLVNDAVKVRTLSYLLTAKNICILVGFLSSARHAIVCILCSLGQSRAVI